MTVTDDVERCRYRWRDRSGRGHACHYSALHTGAHWCPCRDRCERLSNDLATLAGLAP